MHGLHIAVEGAASRHIAESGCGWIGYRVVPGKSDDLR
jgi:hypothetical protein